jgi:5'-nucleotidase
MYREGLDGNTLLNVNIPAVSKRELKGVRVTRLGTRKYVNSFQTRLDPHGREYYWMSGEAVNENNESDCDINLVAENYITITPVHFELTRFDYIERLSKWRFELFKGGNGGA